MADNIYSPDQFRPIMAVWNPTTIFTLKLMTVMFRRVLKPNLYFWPKG